MSLFSGLKKLVRKAVKFVAPAVIATIPVVGPFAATAVRGVIKARAAAKSAGRVQQRAPARGRRNRPRPGIGFVGPPEPPLRQAQPAQQAGFITGRGAPTRFVQRAPTAQAPQGIQQMSIFSQIPALIRTGTQIARRVAGSAGGRAAVIGATTAAGVDILLDEFGNPIRPRRRRMNFGNARAAKRAVRRIKGTQKLLKDIEKLLPRRSAPRARRDLPAGHTHVR